MKVPKLKELLKSALPEGQALPEGLDFDKISEGVNTFANGLIAKNKPNMEKINAEANEKAMSNVVSGLGIDNVKDLGTLKSHIETLGKSSTEHTKEIDRLTKELNDTKTSSSDFETKYNDINTKFVNLERQTEVAKLGVAEKHQQDFITLAAAKVTDELPFSDAAKEVAESNLNWLTETGRENIGGGTGGKTEGKSQLLDEARKNMGI